MAENSGADDDDDSSFSSTVTPSHGVGKRSNNPLALKIDPPRDVEEIEKLKGMDKLRSIFIKSVPEEKRQKIQTTTSGLMAKSRLPPRLGDNLMIKRSSLVELHDPDDVSDGDGTSAMLRRKKDSEVLTDMSEPGASLLNLDKKRRFAMSLATLANKPHKRHSILHEGAIHTLKLLSGNPDEVVQRCCSAAFSFLSLEPEARFRMVDESATAALTKLVMASNDNTVVKFNCARALCNLCLEVGNESRMVKDGVLMSMVNIINHCPETVDICLLTLFNMSCVIERFARIEEMTDVLLRMSVYLTNRAQEHLYLTILCNLSAIRGNQLRMVEDGVQRIVDGVAKSSDEELRVIGATIFSNFCTDNRAKAKMVEQGAIPTLLIMLQDPSEVIRCYAVRAFHSLTKDMQLRAKLFFNETALTLLLKTGRSAYLDVVYGRSVARVYRALSRESGVCYRLVTGGIVDSIRHLVEREDTAILHHCTEALCTLFEETDIVKDLVDASGAEVLLQLALYANNEAIMDGVVLEWTTYSLYRLVMSDICSMSMLQRQVLPCVVQLCGTPFERPRYFCSGILKVISKQVGLKTSSAIIPVIDMMRTDTNPVTQRCCAAALASMIHESENCAIMLEAGALPFIVRLTETDNLATKVKCAAIFSQLSLHERYFDEFARDDVMQVLLGLCAVDHLMTQRCAVMALSNLSHKEALCERLFKMRPVPHLISMAAKRDETLRRGCASIFCNLTAMKGSEKQLLKAEVVASLLVIAMIASDQTVAKTICVKALVNLMAERDAFPQLAKEGVIWCMSSLALDKDMVLSLLCLKALSVFAPDFSREMLDSQSSQQAVFWAIGEGHGELQRLGTRTLTHMLRHSVASERKHVRFRIDAVKAMAPLTRSTDPEVMRLVVLCLCYASQSEPCRGPIATSKMLLTVGGGDSLATPAMCYAYITAVDNVACGDSGIERTELLQDQPDVLLGRFRAIIALRDEALVVATAKALYSLSCSHDNVAVMTQHDVLSLVRETWEQRHPPSGGTRAGPSDRTGAAAAAVHPIDQYLLAVMYNLSSHVVTQGRLVSDGFMELLVEMFDVAQSDKTLCVMACYATFHMACGATSSARLVESGCASILCFFSSPAGMSMYRQNREEFSFDVMMRCAMSIRNMICVVANQRPLVEAGCVDALVEMTDDANNFLGIVSPSQKKGKKGISFKAVQSRAPSVATVEMTMKRLEAEKVHAQAVRKNTAAALRCLTFNTELRAYLEPAGAVDVLLQDLTMEMSEQERDFNIDYSLLSNLESESWENGSRGRQKEGRAAMVPPAPLRLDWLQGNTAVVLDVEVQEEPLVKFTVQTEDEEEKKKKVVAPGRGRVTRGNSPAPSRATSANPGSAAARRTLQRPGPGGAVGGPVDDEVLPDTIGALARFAHDDTGAYTSLPELDRRSCDVLPLAVAINPPTLALVALSDVLGGGASGPPSVAGHLGGDRKASLLALSPLRSPPPPDVASPLQQQQQQLPVPAPTSAPLLHEQHDAAFAFSPGKKVLIDAPVAAAAAAALPELKMPVRLPAPRDTLSRDTQRDTPKSTPNSGSRHGTPASRLTPTSSSAARYDLPPLDGSFESLASPSSQSSMVSTSTGTPKKKVHLNRRDQKFDDLAKLINATHKTKKWSVDTVLDCYQKIQGL